MSYTEKNFQTDFNKWLRIIFRRTGAFELKMSKTKTLPYSAVKRHQLDALFRAKHNIMAYKIPDDAYARKPFDCFTLAGAPAFVVIMFGGKSIDFYMIDIDVFLDEMQQSTRKSLTEERAAEIGSKYDLTGRMPYAHSS